MMVPKEKWSAHANEKYEKDFLKLKDDFVLWCEKQKAMVSVKGWNSNVETEAQTSLLGGCCRLWCQACFTTISKDSLDSRTSSRHRRQFFYSPGAGFTEPDLWCAICGKTVLTTDWNKHAVSEHKESLLEGHGVLWCRICNQTIPSKVWNAHAEGVSMTEEIQKI